MLSVGDLLSWAKEHRGDPTCALSVNPGLRLDLADRAIEAEVARLMSYQVISM